MTTTTILSDNGVSSGSAGIKTTGGNDGTLQLQTTTSGGTATTAVTIGTDQSVTFAQAANLPNTFGFKNRILNGSMAIDQRNAGSPITTTGFSVDRWIFYKDTAGGSLSVQQSSTAPAGFVNSIGLTVTTGITPASGEGNTFMQPIEGLNVADLGWGASGASPVTLSFWVRSSLTGTFGGSLSNSAQNRAYPFTYIINAANTWEQKSITIAGDTTGTWLKTNGVGIRVWFGLGVGASLSGTAGAWAAGNYISTTGATSVVGTNGATFYITGVQLEKGSTATSFDYRPYGTELALCQRYYYNGNGVAEAYLAGYTTSGTSTGVSVQFPVVMRSAPTVTLISTGAAGATTGTPYTQNIVAGSMRVRNDANAGTGGFVWGAYYQLSAEL